ncbi:MAG: GWxTD domain-containing protein [Candidatus Aminicenantes bacterium]|nr:GWxTD domain-containing protein [Candidatus Aminicenantes bacterium]
MPASTSTSGEGRPRFVPAPLLALLVLLAGCSSAGGRIAVDPHFESFFEKARLIMTREEVQIYKHLPDNAAREEFIEEFWRQRDPFPETPENENKIEFERRIAYANRWFRENRAAGRGWDTPRGRILIQLGEPDNRYLNEMINNPSVKGYERWIYYYYQLELVFIDSQGFGEFKLQTWPAELLSAIDHAKFTLNAGGPQTLKSALSFDAAYRNGAIIVSIPLKKVRFREQGDTVSADYRIAVTVYRDYRKVDFQAFTRQLEFPRAALPDKKDLTFSLPYPLERKGKYYFDVVLEDVLTGSRSRAFAEAKK